VRSPEPHLARGSSIQGIYIQYIRKWNGAYALLGAFLVAACGGGAGESPADMQGLEVERRTAALVASASYDSSLQAPMCTGAASGCSSGTLLNGRASLGPELNAPNTLRGSTCADGTMGTYRMDESVEQVRVSTVDGSTLEVGKQMRVEVTVWAYSASNNLDLYYTADATQPVWNYITTLGATGPGLQTLSTTYTLPSGRGVQAVRAAFRWAVAPAPAPRGCMTTGMTWLLP
jgi:hypothetical protein